MEKGRQEVKVELSVFVISRDLSLPMGEGRGEGMHSEQTIAGNVAEILEA